MKCVKLRNAKVSDNGLKKLIKHRLHELELIKCADITQASLEVLNEYSDQLHTLTLGPQCNMFPSNLAEMGDKSKSEDIEMTEFGMTLLGTDKPFQSFTYKDRGKF